MALGINTRRLDLKLFPSWEKFLEEEKETSKDLITVAREERQLVHFEGNWNGGGRTKGASR